MQAHFRYYYGTSIRHHIKVGTHVFYHKQRDQPHSHRISRNLRSTFFIEKKRKKEKLFPMNDFTLPKIHHTCDTRGSHAEVIGFGHNPCAFVHVNLIQLKSMIWWVLIWPAKGSKCDACHTTIPQCQAISGKSSPNFLNLHLWLSSNVAHKFPRHPHWKSVNVRNGDWNNTSS